MAHNCTRSDIPGAEHGPILPSLDPIIGWYVRKGIRLMLSVQFLVCNYYPRRME